jgi:hypothetical protein
MVVPTATQVVDELAILDADTLLRNTERSFEHHYSPRPFDCYLRRVAVNCGLPCEAEDSSSVAATYFMDSTEFGNTWEQ